MYCHKNDLLSSRALLLRFLQSKSIALISTINNMLHAFKNLAKFTLRERRISMYRFGGLTSTFLQASNEKNTQIISLTMEEIQQLSTISHYSTSIQHLKQNKLADSLMQLEFALSEAKNKYPWSINLQSCLINRMSILNKLLNRKKNFQKLLQQLYLISLSSKGSKSLDTIKNLINYLICLTIYNPSKCNAVLQYISKDNLPDYVLFFDALNTIRERRDYQNGLKKLYELPEEFPYERIFKYNNISFMRIYCLREQFKNPNDYSKELKRQSNEILAMLLRALLEAEKNHENTAEFSKQENEASIKLQEQINLYLKGERKELPTDKLMHKRILKHSNSHIISMNIASLLFELERSNQCFYFLQLTLEKAISENQLERVGIALTLLGRCYYLQGQQKWQQTYIDILQHGSTYPKAVIKQALATYSRLLFQQGHYYEAQNYLNQALSIQAEGGIEGLIIPSYDFSF